VDGLMMDYQLNVPAIMRRADELYGESEIASRLPDKSWHTYTYADFVARTKKLVVALRKLGLEDGDRVGTFMWNHSSHLEAYVGAPAGGFVTHTLNLRLHPDDNVYIATHGGDRVLLVDKVLWPLAEPFVSRCAFEHVIAVGAGAAPEGTIDYDELLADADESAFTYRDLAENTAAAMCYTSGTTGRPKGVLYSHRAIALHALTVNAALGIHAGDVSLPVVPMFHANAWCFPFSSTMTGVKQVFPGPHMDPETLLDGLAEQKVTVTAGVPTIWMGILQALDANPGRWDLSSLRLMTVGGSAPPRALIEALSERHGLNIVHGWGMTEMCPVGTLSGAPGQEIGLEPQEAYTRRALQGLPIPFVEIRASGADGFVPWDGETMGELEVRGPSIASAYFESAEGADRWTADGWFKTGDVVTIHSDGFVEVQDRAKDLVKSGGEWISTVALENALMGHPAVAEAAVIAVPDEKWSERPLAVVVLREGEDASPDELRDFLAPSFAKWWLPDRFEFVDEIPKTAVGKFRKTALREQFAAQPEPAETA
jgi:acyl-CoA synthetase (AMP-forming)/AMP-acid ligase II